MEKEGNGNIILLSEAADDHGIKLLVTCQE